jgi:hypothetical protein
MKKVKILSSSDNLLKVIEVANLLKVSPDAILLWVSEGKLEPIEIDNEFYITPKSYNEFTSNNLQEIFHKVAENLWSQTLLVEPVAREEVNKRIRTNASIVLDRAKSAVNLLESIHKKYEPHLDLFNSKHGGIAAFITYARIISLLYSIIALLRSTVFSESYILLRPLWEAILLAEYFTLSEANHENTRCISRWFDKEETPQPSEIRKYISEKNKIPIELLNKQYRLYSKPVHHTYESIMENYRAMHLDAFGKEYSKRSGFDYHESTRMRDIVTLILALEGLLQPAIRTFRVCFAEGLAFTQEEIKELDEEAKFYLIESEERMKIIFNQT